MEVALPASSSCVDEAAQPSRTVYCAPPSFTTSRLQFVPLAPVHAEDLISMQHDPRVCRYLTHDVYSAYESALGLVHYANEEHTRHPGLGIWHVSTRTDNRFVGIFSLHYVHALQAVELGVVFSRDGWGKRLVPDFGRAVLEYAFRTLGERRLIALTDPANRSAAFWLEAYGFRLKADVLVDGVPQSLFLIDEATWTQLHGNADGNPYAWRARAKRG